MNAFQHGQIHRFRDSIALYVRGEDRKGVTVYLSEADARNLARVLVECADDVAALPFTASQFGTVAFDGSAP